MSDRFRLYAVLASLFGLAAVAIGAFGAHGVKDPAIKNLIDVGAHYHFVHTLAAFAGLMFWRWGASRARFAVPFHHANFLNARHGRRHQQFIDHSHTPSGSSPSLRGYQVSDRLHHALRIRQTGRL